MSMDVRHPTTHREIDSWCKGLRLPKRTGRLRFAQREVLCAIAASDIGRSIVFKGGNALRIMHGNPRGTLDLDFTAVESVPDQEAWFSDHVGAAVSGVPQVRGIKMRAQSIKRLPPKPGAHLPTYSVRIGFCIAGDRGYDLKYVENGRDMNEIVELEISLNDLVCEWASYRIDEAQNGSIATCTIDDILGEKLRSLLQQLIRNRTRPQDVYDIAKQWRDRRDSLNLGHIREYTLRKCEIRQIEPRRSSFDDEVRLRAEEGYGHLREHTGADYIEFDVAWGLVLELIGEIGLPD